MDYIIKNIHPLDLQPSKGIGINIPFNGSTGLNITYETKESIRTNLLNFLLTSTRERIMNPNFGTNIRNQIFENISTNNMKNIEDIIFHYVKDNFPSIKLEQIIITPNNHTIDIYFKYSIINTNITDDIQLNFNKSD